MAHMILIKLNTIFVKRFSFAHFFKSVKAFYIGNYSLKQINKKKLLFKYFIPHIKNLSDFINFTLIITITENNRFST